MRGRTDPLITERDTLIIRTWGIGIDRTAYKKGRSSLTGIHLRHVNPGMLVQYLHTGIISNKITPASVCVRHIALVYSFSDTAEIS